MKTSYKRKNINIIDLFNYNSLCHELIEDILDCLSLSERDYVCRRYGINDYLDEGGKTLSELKEVYNKSASALYQYECSVFDKAKLILLSKYTEKIENNKKSGNNSRYIEDIK